MVKCYVVGRSPRHPKGNWALCLTYQTSGPSNTWLLCHSTYTNERATFRYRRSLGRVHFKTPHHHTPARNFLNSQLILLLSPWGTTRLLLPPVLCVAITLYESSTLLNRATPPSGFGLHTRETSKRTNSQLHSVKMSFFFGRCSNGSIVNLLCEPSPAYTSAFDDNSRSSTSRSGQRSFSDDTTSYTGTSETSSQRSVSESLYGPDDYAPPSCPRSQSPSHLERHQRSPTTSQSARKRPATHPPSSPQKSSSSNTKRRYTCQECTRSFTTSGHLARHMRIHTGIKPFTCLLPGCTNRFSRQDNMMQHYRTHLLKLQRGKGGFVVSVDPALASRTAENARRQREMDAKAASETEGMLTPESTPKRRRK
ncbi:hypothetical protein BC832DRAFT_348550 [Gaertneriomyces semiglobifer]|nr:hypothetical protein BC832DRAFT_348550 [Gaertneriomyces semiglobifer]